MEFAGRTALVTGASRGIGRAVALEMAKRGANVAFAYAGNNEAADGTLRELASLGAAAMARRCNVAAFEEVAELVKAAEERFGGVDILVNNAGITRDALVMGMSEEDFDAVIATNLKGAFNTIRHLYRAFARRRAGRIINISSVVGLCGNAGQANYAAAKAGLLGLTKSVAKELASRGVTCNAIAPGFIESDMTAALTEPQKAAALGKVPAARMGTPNEVAALAAFLATDAAGYITGQVFSVDGGMYM